MTTPVNVLHIQHLYGVRALTDEVHTLLSSYNVNVVPVPIHAIDLPNT